MTTLLLRKRFGGTLEPVDDSGREVLAKVKTGATIKAEVTRPRNVHFHRKFFAMLNLVYQNQEHYKSLDDLLDVCKLRIGHVRSIQTKGGIEKVPASISFANMDDTAFSNFYDRAVQWVTTEVIPGLQRHELDGEIEEELREFAA